MKRCAISVDLDEIPNYSAIHGHEGSDSQLNQDAVYQIALPRLRAWAAGHAIPLTLFAIARDIQRPQPASAMTEMLALGHELGNHSLDHHYDLTTLTRSEQVEQVDGAQCLFEERLGQKPVGFRAPGYTITDRLYEVLSELGFEYSSSVFPCPPYYLAKVAAIGSKRLFGRRSASLVDDPRVLTAPTQPYRVGKPYWRRGGGLLEIPIQTTPGLRLPFIGTSITTFGTPLARWMAWSLRESPLINLELHGIDLLDQHDGLQPLAQAQPDLQVPLTSKLAALDSVVDTLKLAGYSFTTLQEAGKALRS